MGNFEHIAEYSNWWKSQGFEWNYGLEVEFKLEDGEKSARIRPSNDSELRVMIENNIFELTSCKALTQEQRPFKLSDDEIDSLTQKMWSFSREEMAVFEIRKRLEGIIEYRSPESYFDGPYAEVQASYQRKDGTIATASDVLNSYSSICGTVMEVAEIYGLNANIRGHHLNASILYSGNNHPAKNLLQTNSNPEKSNVTGINFDELLGKKLLETTDEEAIGFTGRAVHGICCAITKHMHNPNVGEQIAQAKSGRGADIRINKNRFESRIGTSVGYNPAFLEKEIECLLFGAANGVYFLTPDYEVVTKASFSTKEGGNPFLGYLRDAVEAVRINANGKLDADEGLIRFTFTSIFGAVFMQTPMEEHIAPYTQYFIDAVNSLSFNADGSLNFTNLPEGPNLPKSFTRQGTDRELLIGALNKMKPEGLFNSIETDGREKNLAPQAFQVSQLETLTLPEPSIAIISSQHV